MKKLLVVLLLLYPLSASAVTYEWTDQAGTVNFTEDLGKVPKKYRKKVKVLGAEESGTPAIIENSEPAKGKTKELATPVTAKEQKPLHPKAETTFRNDYLNTKANLQATEQETTILRTRLADTSKLSRSEYLSLQNALKQNELRIQEQKRQLDQIREKADKAGISLGM
jgi:hypothetical protein